MTPLDTIYTGGHFYTVDSERPWAEALGIADGNIAVIGSNEDVRALADKSTHVVDLGGAMVMPGLHDGHVHLLEQSLRNTQIQCQLHDPQTIDELGEQLLDYHKKNPHREWVIASIYNSQVLTNELVTKVWLDKLLPGIPVILYDHTAMHVCIASDEALRRAQITHETPNPDGGVIRRDSNGEATGWLTETATALVRFAAPSYTTDEIDQALTYATNLCAEFGITSVQEAGSYRSLLDSLMRLESRGDLKTFVFAHLVYNFPAWGGWGTTLFDELMADRERYRGDLVAPDGVKVFLDGTSLPPQFTHVPLNETTGEVDTTNLLVSQSTLVDKIREWTNAGLKIKSHASGMGAVRIGLDMYERALEGRTPSIPHDIAHSRWVSETDLPRYAQIGVVGEMSPTIWQDPRFKETLGGAFRFASLWRSGAHLSLGSDWLLPQTPNLFPGIGGMLDWGDESLTLENAIQMATLNGAKSIGKDDRFGSLEVGKDATFIVLDRNLFQSTPAEIEQTRVTLTVRQGTVVYLANEEVTSCSA